MYDTNIHVNTHTVATLAVHKMKAEYFGVSDVFLFILGKPINHPKAL